VLEALERHAGFRSLRVTTKNKGKMNIRAKMYVTSVSKAGETENINLSAVCSGSEENKQFAKYTPCASVNISIDNPSAQGVLTQGKEFYVDFIPA